MHDKLHSITTHPVARLVRLAAVAAMAALLGACGGGGGGGGSSKSAAASGNTAPTLTGNPSADAQVGTPYTVSPTAQDADGDMLAFSIRNLPHWAQFNTATGQLSGTPAAGDVGVYPNIVISVSDGKAQQSLPEFTVKVGPAGSRPGSSNPGNSGAGPGAVTVQWQAPKNGAETLSGYRIYYGKDAGTLTEKIDVPNAGVLTYVVENLPPGKYYFAITAVNATGLESQMSNVLSKSI